MRPRDGDDRESIGLIELTRNLARGQESDANRLACKAA
jgi:hypothetical protein